MMAAMTKTASCAAPRQGPAAVLADLKAELEDRIEELRNRIAGTQAELEAVVEGSVPKAEYLARVNDWVDAKAAHFGTEVQYSLSGLRLPGRPEPVTFGRVPVTGSLTAGMVAEADVAAPICWLLNAEIKKKLAEAINASGYTEGPPLADRPKLRKELQSAIDELELAEERLIVEAESAGLTIARRHDCRPEIVLSLALGNTR